MPTSSLDGHNQQAIWTALMSSWKVLLCWENPVRNVELTRCLFGFVVCGRCRGLGGGASCSCGLCGAF